MLVSPRIAAMTLGAIGTLAVTAAALVGGRHHPPDLGEPVVLPASSPGPTASPVGADRTVGIVRSVAPTRTSTSPTPVRRTERPPARPARTTRTSAPAAVPGSDDHDDDRGEDTRGRDDGGQDDRDDRDEGDDRDDEADDADDDGDDEDD
jgi:hypothetical protein